MNAVKSFVQNLYLWLNTEILWILGLTRLKIFNLRKRIVASELLDTPEKQFVRALHLFLSIIRDENRRQAGLRSKELIRFASSPDFEHWANPIGQRGLIFKESLVNLCGAFIDNVAKVVIPNCERFSDTNIQRLRTELERIFNRFAEESVHNQEAFFYSRFPTGFPDVMKQFEVSQLRSIYSEYVAKLDGVVNQANLEKRTARRERRVIDFRRIVISLLIGYILGILT